MKNRNAKKRPQNSKKTNGQGDDVFNAQIFVDELNGHGDHNKNLILTNSLIKLKERKHVTEVLEILKLKTGHPIQQTLQQHHDQLPHHKH